MSKKKRAPKIGEVYATILPNEYWCALVVLNVIENSYLVYTTAYYDLKPPSADDPSLTEFYYSKDWYSDGTKPTIYWIDGKPDERYHLIGEIDLQEKSDIKESAYYYGIWKTYTPQEVMWEKDPSTIPKAIETKPSEHQADEPIDLEEDAEELLEVASEAYEKKTDEPFDYVSTYDYETYSNKSAWEKDV